VENIIKAIVKANYWDKSSKEMQYDSRTVFQLRSYNQSFLSVNFDAKKDISYPQVNSFGTNENFQILLTNQGYNFQSVD